MSGSYLITLLYYDAFGSILYFCKCNENAHAIPNRPETEVFDFVQNSEIDKILVSEEND